MKAGTPFRAAMMMSLALATLAQAHKVGSVGFQAGLNDIGPYEGRGKHRARHHDQGGTRAFQRAAIKARNVRKHRRACRG